MLKTAPTNKIDFYQRYLAGEFGNRPRTWATWPELRDSSYNGRVTIRNTTPGATCHYGVSVSDLRAGVLPDKVDFFCSRFNESMPDDKLVIQGNVVLYFGGIVLEYSTEPNIGHRDAVCEPHMKRAHGLEAISLLKAHLWPSDYDDLQDLLDTYQNECTEQGAVIEFSAYSIPVGIIPGRRVVLWEVRNY